MESIFSEPAPQIKALVRNLSAFTTLFAPGKSWDNVRSTAAPYTESRLTRSVANERAGFPVVEHIHTFIQSHSYNTFIHRHLLGPLSISSLLESSVGRPSLWCRAEKRTRACLTARRRATNWATLHHGKKDVQTERGNKYTLKLAIFSTPYCLLSRGLL